MLARGRGAWLMNRNKRQWGEGMGVFEEEWGCLVGGGRRTRLENMVRTCLIDGMERNGPKSLKLLMANFPGRRMGRLVLFLHDGRLRQQPAGMAVGLRGRREQDQSPPPRPSAVGRLHCVDRRTSRALISAALSLL